MRLCGFWRINFQIHVNKWFVIKWFVSQGIKQNNKKPKKLPERAFSCINQSMVYLEIFIRRTSNRFMVEFLKRITLHVSMVHGNTGMHMFLLGYKGERRPFRIVLVHPTPASFLQTVAC